MAVGVVCAHAPAQKDAARNRNVSANPENRRGDMDDLLNMAFPPGRLIPTFFVV
jgi:hypothetical protein